MLKKKLKCYIKYKPNIFINTEYILPDPSQSRSEKHQLLAGQSATGREGAGGGRRCAPGLEAEGSRCVPGLEAGGRR